jgi:phosphate transport system protein
METHLETELDSLKQRLLIMANHAETAVIHALQALNQRDDNLALQVKQSDRIIDQFEVEIDDLVIQQLTKAPLATDLRMVTAALKISHNLERVGDEAAKIARQAAALSRQPAIKVQLDLPCLATLTLEMLKAALDAFSHRDAVAARAVIPQDKEADLLNKQIHNILVEYMAANPHTIRGCLRWMVVSKSLERIADHATNIAEDVVYFCEAQDIRHTGIKSGRTSVVSPA